MRMQNRLGLTLPTLRPTAGGPRSIRLRTFGLLSALAAIIVLVSACQKVPMPRSDESAPQVHWVVIDSPTGERIETDPEETESAVEVAGPAVVLLVAEDSKGVHRIKLFDPVSGYLCSDGDLQKSFNPGLATTYQEDTLGPDSKGYVLTELMLADTAYMMFDCGPGWHLLHGSTTFIGEAENYFGGVTPSELRLVYTP